MKSENTVNIKKLIEYAEKLESQGSFWASVGIEGIFYDSKVCSM